MQLRFSGMDGEREGWMCWFEEKTDWTFKRIRGGWQLVTLQENKILTIFLDIHPIDHQYLKYFVICNNVGLSFRYFQGACKLEELETWLSTIVTELTR